MHTEVNFGQKVLIFQVPVDIVKEINLTYETNFKDLKEHNKYLAGKIRDEHLISDFLSTRVKDYFLNRFKEYPTQYSPLNPTLELRSAWINEMKSGEYNPVHRHSGGTVYGFSSVLFLKLPSSYGEEYTLKNMPTNGILAFIGNGGGLFNFNHARFKPKIGDLFIFPYDMFHCVYPFNTTKEVRRSLSYNCDLFPSKPKGIK